MVCLPADEIGVGEVISLAVPVGQEEDVPVDVL